MHTTLGKQGLEQIRFLVEHHVNPAKVVIVIWIWILTWTITNALLNTVVTWLWHNWQNQLSTDELRAQNIAALMDQGLETASFFHWILPESHTWSDMAVMVTCTLLKRSYQCSMIRVWLHKMLSACSLTTQGVCSCISAQLTTAVNDFYVVITHWRRLEQKLCSSLRQYSSMW